MKENKRNDPLNRRLAEIERERRRLEREMRSLNRTKSGCKTAPPTTTERGQEARGSGIRPQVESRERSPSHRGPSVERLNHYLSSGSFGKCRPLRHERAKQRNRAIFMIIVVLVAIFIILRML